MLGCIKSIVFSFGFLLLCFPPVFLHASPVHFSFHICPVSCSLALRWSQCFSPACCYLHTCPVSVSSALPCSQCFPQPISSQPARVSCHLFLVFWLVQFVFKIWFAVQFCWIHCSVEFVLFSLFSCVLLLFFCLQSLRNEEGFLQPCWTSWQLGKKSLIWTALD